MRLREGKSLGSLIGRCVLAGFAGAAAAAATASSAAGAFLADVNGPLALRFAPWNAEALGSAAAQRIDGSNPGAATALARSALQRDATTIAAWRVLGTQSALIGKTDDATRIMRFSERLTRRDLATQLWLIEDSVRRNDVGEALRHYDNALSTNRAARDLLLPNLASALSAPALGKPITALVARRPNWLEPFLNALTRFAKPDEQAVDLLVAVRRGGYTPALAEATAFPGRLADEGKWKQAARAYVAIQPRSVRDIESDTGGFDREPKIAPFDWALASSSNLQAYADEPVRKGGAPTLRIAASDGEAGTPARKLLLLGPGQYRLGIGVRSLAPPLPAKAALSIRCAGEQQDLLSQSIVPPAQSRPIATQFSVPQECPAQWINVDFEAADDLRMSEIVIDGIRIAPLVQTASSSR